MDSGIPFEFIATTFALGALSINVLSIIILSILILEYVAPMKKIAMKIKNIFQKFGLYFAFIFSLGATAGSLFMSELGGLEPCTLCWYQRVFMYPQTFLFLLATYYKDTKVFLYSLFLSAIGLGIALWHVFIEYQPQFETCSETSIACSAIQFEAFGFVTIPFMSASTFLFLVLLSIFSLRASSKK